MGTVLEIFSAKDQKTINLRGKIIFLLMNVRFVKRISICRDFMWRLKLSESRRR